jgi:hypothetical protein
MGLGPNLEQAKGKTWLSPASTTFDLFLFTLTVIFVIPPVLLFSWGIVTIDRIIGYLKHEKRISEGVWR